MADDLVREAEQIVLGAMMLDPGVIGPVADRLRSADFADVRHGAIFASITANYAGSADTGPVAVAMALQAIGELQRVGGANYLHELIAAVPTSASAGWYAGMVADAAYARDARADAVRLAQIAEAGDRDRITEELARLAERWSGSRDPSDTDGRRLDLGPWLDGTYEPPRPQRGAVRDDGAHLLYPNRWHTCIAPSESGKSMWGIAHARDEMNAGRDVACLHFEETDPGGTVSRLLAIGVHPDVIRKHFVWLSCDRTWVPGELAAELADLTPGLVLLDGINAACSRHGQDVEKTSAVGWYRHTFVTPATRLGWVVLSLGHPPKARDRQAERHGFGSTAWLDEADGVGFRLVAHPAHPIRRANSGTATLYSVKDRYGEVTRLGSPDRDREGWTYLGSLVVDDTGAETRVRVSVPHSATDTNRSDTDEIDRLASTVVELLRERPERGYDSERQLTTLLRAAKVTFADHDLAPALERLERSGQLDRDPYRARKPRSGRLAAAAQDQEEN